MYVSDLRRAVQTAEIAFAGHSVPVVLDARLRECNYGDMNGMPVAQLRTERREHIRVPFPAGESYLQVVARTADFLAALLAMRDGQSVILISHSANRWALDHLIHGARLEDLVSAEFDWQPGWEYVLDTL